MLKLIGIKTLTNLSVTILEILSYSIKIQNTYSVEKEYIMSHTL
jgi:hypothetical protein